MAAALDAPRRWHSVDGTGGPPPRAELRARDQRVLSDGHRSAPHRMAPRHPQGAERLALRASLLRRAVRAAGAAPVHALPAAGDHGLLMTTVLDPRVAYELWAPTYEASAHNPLMAAEQAVVTKLLAQVTAARALDVGMGSGRYLPILAEVPVSARRFSTSVKPRVVVGIDFSIAMLKRSEPAARVCADALHLPFARAMFDLVNASLMVGDVDNLTAWAREMARVLTVGGHLIYSDFHPTWTENGWQRTFRSADGEMHAVRFQPHAIEDHLTALEAAGFHVQAIREPRLTVGRRELPVLAVFHATREPRNARQAP